jgi:hypothetical protein
LEGATAAVVGVAMEGSVGITGIVIVGTKVGVWLSIGRLDTGQAHASKNTAAIKLMARRVLLFIDSPYDYEVIVAGSTYYPKNSLVLQEVYPSYFIEMKAITVISNIP